MLEIEKVPELLQLVAPISAILGPSWKFDVDTDDWENALHVSWHPDSSPSDHPVAVDFYTSSMQGPCVVQVFGISHPKLSAEIQEKITAVLEYCNRNKIPYGFEQS
jgi:hypothetical protein